MSNSPRNDNPKITKTVKKIILAVALVAMSLATAWAVRGQFGHEQGAAWAGAIGGLALVLVSNRKDWYNKTTGVR